MNQIGFKNFRKFQNFPTIDLGDITILVGGNNAGKSTLVKAILLMRDFLKSRIESIEKTNNIFSTFEPKFSFDSEHVNIGDFYRAFCHQSPSKENTISFTMTIEKFKFVVNIRGERKPGVLPRVSMIAVSDEDRDISFVFDFSKNQMTVRFVYDDMALNNFEEETSHIESEIDYLRNALSKSKDLDEISNIKLQLEQLEKQVSTVKQDFSISEDATVTVSMSYFRGDNVGKLIIPELIKGFVHYSETASRGDKRSAAFKEKEANKAFISGKAVEINAIAEEIEKVLNKQEIEYIYAHSVYQDSVYAKCANSSDYTKRTIHEFYTSRISKGDDEFSLIEDWLKEFKIGTSLKVIPFKGDNYSLVIFDDDNPEIKSDKRKGYPGGIDLADKGMGSIQIVILLLRIATLIRKYKGQHLTVLLEEPEQNLHPATQSKLTEFVVYVKENYGVNFIIETHSEYLIRKSQVMVAEHGYENENEMEAENPFAIFFLYPNPQVEPKKMTYDLSGAFKEKFGEGFYDEASKWDMIIIRKEIELQKKNRK